MAPQIIPPTWVAAAVFWEIEKQILDALQAEADPGNSQTQAAPLFRPRFDLRFSSGVMPPDGRATWEKLGHSTSYDGASGGPPWIGTFESLWQPALSAPGESLLIALPLACSDRSPFLLAPGLASLWTSSLAFRHPMVTPQS